MIRRIINQDWISNSTKRLVKIEDISKSLCQVSYKPRLLIMFLHQIIILIKREIKITISWIQQRERKLEK